MGQASKYLRNVSDGAGRKGYGHWCAGCEELHVYWVDGTARPNWSFNGNVERPSFSPSMRLSYNGADAGQDRGDGFGKAPPACCHYFVRLGRELGPSYDADAPYIQYCGDTTHALSGQTLPLPELPEHVRD